MEISQDLCFRPIVFIRFNPDNYKNGDKNITSCWGTNQKGIHNIKKSKEKEWNNRLEILYTHIEHWINTVPDKTIEIDYLFYDKLSL